MSSPAARLCAATPWLGATGRHLQRQMVERNDVYEKFSNQPCARRSQARRIAFGCLTRKRSEGRYPPAYRKRSMNSLKIARYLASFQEPGVQKPFSRVPPTKGCHLLSPLHRNRRLTKNAALVLREMA